MKITKRQLRRIIQEEVSNAYGWDVSNKKNTMLNKKGMEKSDRENAEKFLKSMHLMGEALTKSDEDRIGVIVRRETKAMFKDDFMPKLQAEIEASFTGKDHQDEVVDIVKRVIARLVKDLAITKSHVIDSIRI